VVQEYELQIQEEQLYELQLFHDCHQLLQSMLGDGEERIFFLDLQMYSKQELIPFVV
jgi:hypothetical protein